MTRTATARHWALLMTRKPSVSGTADEASFGPWLALELAQAFPQAEVWTFPVAAGDGRHCVALLLRGQGARTLVLTGHYDTVTVADYGDLMPDAIDPERLTQSLLARLRKSAASPAEVRALRDLESGDFLPGRGLLDMKAGLAAGLAVCDTFTAQDAGNLLFLAVPDEEVNSVGARAAAPELARVAADRSLDLVGAVNLDAIADDGTGEAGQAIALGTIGKLLPFAFVVGRSTHAGFPLAGINAAVLAGGIALAVEWASELTDPATGGTRPSLLSLRDGKAGYDVTTPGTAFAAFNVLTVARSPGQVLAAFDELCAQGAAQALAALAARVPDLALPRDIPVIRFSALDAQVRAANPAAHSAARENLPAGLALPDLCRFVTGRMWQASGRTGPAVVTGFGSVPYLPTQLSNLPQARRLHAAAASAAADIGHHYGMAIHLAPVFAGISDMSFLGEADARGLATVAAETPVWGTALRWPDQGGIAGLPIVNAGPWGRDYHTPLERMHVRYGFEVLPDLLDTLARTVLAAERGT
ncbi:MAG: M20/M25/M40 family metallo-hydrolase [Candidatus Saccharibacteria bacterium]|nr:M20/M25/M40 family metallo-hydrolase [Pseudorhodobacter sp.]